MTSIAANAVSFVAVTQKKSMPELVLYPSIRCNRTNHYGASAVTLQASIRQPVPPAAAVRHLVGSVTKTEGLRFAIIYMRSTSRLVFFVVPLLGKEMTMEHHTICYLTGNVVGKKLLTFGTTHVIQDTIIDITASTFLKVPRVDCK